MSGGTSLAEKIAAEARAERPCPRCGTDRVYSMVWRNIEPFTRRGENVLVCPVHGPFSDPRDT